MTNEYAIMQLECLRDYAKSRKSATNNSIYECDIQALNIAIRALKKIVSTKGGEENE